MEAVVEVVWETEVTVERELVTCPLPLCFSSAVSLRSPFLFSFHFKEDYFGFFRSRFLTEIKSWLTTYEIFRGKNWAQLSRHMEEQENPQPRKRPRLEDRENPAELKPFPHPFLRGEYGTGAHPRTLVELEMMRLSGFIRGRPLWWEKRLKEEITTKWRKDALKQGFTKEQFDYVLAELEHYDSLRQGGLQVSAVDGVWQADDWIPQELVEALKVGVAKLEAVPEHEKDWHPGTREQV